MNYIVSGKGPLDRHAPGTEVGALYAPDVLARLVKEGYVTKQAEKGETWPPKAPTPKS